MFSKEEISCGVISSLIIICPTIFLVILFRKSAPFSRRKSRFDKVIDDAAASGKIILPQKSHTRKVVNEKYVKDSESRFTLFFRETGLPSTCYFFAWILTAIFIMVSMALVAAYGFTFGNLKTYQWITSIVVNFFWNIFVESVIKVRKGTKI